MMQFILVALLKAILGLILEKVSPDVKAALRKGMDEVKAEEQNKVDEAVLSAFDKVTRDQSGINAPIDSP